MLTACVLALVAAGCWQCGSWLGRAVVWYVRPWTDAPKPAWTPAEIMEREG